MNLARLVAVVMIAMLAPGAAAAEVCHNGTERVALTIANYDYQPDTQPAVAVPVDGQTDEERVLLLGDLEGPAADVDKLSALLCANGFTVHRVENVDRDGFDAALDAFEAAVQGADVALFHYAGHGMALGDTNFLVPVGGTIKASMFNSVRRQERRGLIDLEEDVLPALAGARTEVLLIDACRNNPLFPPRGGRGPQEQAGRGFRSIEATRAEGRYSFFSAGDGQVADDVYKDGLSPFMYFLSNALVANPRRDWRSLFADVAIAVAEAVPPQRPSFVPDLAPELCLSGACGESPAAFVPSLSSGVEALVAERYESAEDNLAPLAAAGDADAKFALAALAFSRDRTAFEVVPLIADAALAGHTEAKRIMAVLHQAASGDYSYYLKGIRFNEDAESGSFLSHDEYYSAWKVAGEKYPELRSLDVPTLAASDPYAMLVLHDATRRQAESAALAIDEEGPVPDEAISSLMEKAVALGDSTALMRTGLLDLGRPYPGIYVYEAIPEQPLTTGAVDKMARAAEGGNSRALHFLKVWRLDAGDPLPGIDDAALRALSDATADARHGLGSILSAQHFMDTGGSAVPDSQMLLTAAEFVLRGIGGPVDVSRGRALYERLLVADASDSTYRSPHVRALLREQEGDRRGALVDLASVSYWSSTRSLKDLLRLGDALGWDDDALATAVGFFENYDCSGLECPRVATAVIATGQPRLVMSLAESVRTNAFVGDDEARARLAVFADLATVVVRDIPEDARTERLSTSRLVADFTDAAKRGSEVASEWLALHGHAVPVRESRTFGTVHDNWQFIRFQSDRGNNCYVTSKEAIKLGASPPRQNEPNLIIYTSGAAPGPGLLQYNAQLDAQPSGEISATWDSGFVASGRVGSSDRILLFGRADPQIVAEMARGRIVTIAFRTADGRLVQDTYSLFGFTAAYLDMVAGCPNMTSGLQ